MASDEYGADDVARATGGVQSDPGLRSHNPTVPDEPLVPAATGAVVNMSGRFSRAPERFRAAAAQMVGIAEMGGIRATLEKLLREHRPFPLGSHPVACSSRSHGPREGPQWPCDIFELAATNLELLEILDGSRFTSDWPGPVKVRRW